MEATSSPHILLTTHGCFTIVVMSFGSQSLELMCITIISRGSQFISETPLRREWGSLGSAMPQVFFLRNTKHCKEHLCMVLQWTLTNPTLIIQTLVNPNPLSVLYNDICSNFGVHYLEIGLVPIENANP